MLRFIGPPASGTTINGNIPIMGVAGKGLRFPYTPVYNISKSVQQNGIILSWSVYNTEPPSQRAESRSTSIIRCTSSRGLDWRSFHWGWAPAKSEVYLFVRFVGMSAVATSSAKLYYTFSQLRRIFESAEITLNSHSFYNMPVPQPNCNVTVISVSPAYHWGVLKLSDD